MNDSIGVPVVGLPVPDVGSPPVDLIKATGVLAAGAVTTPNQQIIPDSELVFSATGTNFDIADYVANAYKNFFSHQSRFVLQDLSKADALLGKSKLPYYKVIDDADVLNQIARSMRSESIIRTKIYKEGTRYRFVIDWLHAVRMELIASETVVIEEQRGIADLPPSATRIRIGDGKIGWVAENKVEMVAEDWLNLSRTDGRNLADNHPAFRLSLLGPLVHRGASQDHLIGVLAIGDPATRPKDEKLVLQMVTNLGAIAYRNVRNVRALREQANHDGLTGLLNRRHFMVELGKLMFAADRRAQPLAVFMFDIDHFKRYNDSNGHQAGDEILRGVAETIQSNLRPQDLACRYGGEEFIVAMPLTGVEQAEQVAERIRQSIADCPFSHRETQPDGVLSISGGVAVFPMDGQNSTDLIRNADQALYRAKSAGRNRVLRHRGYEIGDTGTENLASHPDPAPRGGTLGPVGR